jgi:hypothetical protein
MLEHQQPQHHVRRGSRSAAAAALRAPLGEGLGYRGDDLRVVPQPIGLSHPGFLQIGDLGGDQPIAETALHPPPLNHGLRLRDWPASSGRSSAWLISQIASIASFSL